MNTSQKLSQSVFNSRPALLLLLAALMHVSLCVLMYLVGSYELAPHMFETSGIGMFATDAGRYQGEIQLMVQRLQRDGIIAWLTEAPALHVKLYSLSSIILAPLVGPNILNVEPLNLLYYLTTLFLIFRLGKETWCRNAGLLAAFIVGLWPTFLLHSVQPLREPLFIVAMLAWILISLRWLTRSFSWAQALVNAAAGSAASLFLWLVKGSIWELVLAFAFLPLGFCVIRQVREKRFLPANLIGALLMLVMVITIPKLVSPLLKPIYLPTPTIATSESSQQSKTEGHREVMFLRLPERIAYARSEFRRQYEAPGSNLDADVQFSDSVDIARYLPRAMVIGFFAPFPNMWFSAGKQVGLAGRITSGLETLGMFVIYGFVILGLWRCQRRLPLLLLLSTAAIGVTALGMVVINVGALYRMRLVFWMLLIVLGAGGVVQTLSRRSTANLVSDS